MLDDITVQSSISEMWRFERTVRTTATTGYNLLSQRGHGVSVRDTDW